MVMLLLDAECWMLAGMGYEGSLPKSLNNYLLF